MGSKSELTSKLILPSPYQVILVYCVIFFHKTCHVSSMSAIKIPCINYCFFVGILSTRVQSCDVGTLRHLGTFWNIATFWEALHHKIWTATKKDPPKHFMKAQVLEITLETTAETKEPALYIIVVSLWRKSKRGSRESVWGRIQAWRAIGKTRLFILNDQWWWWLRCFFSG